VPIARRLLTLTLLVGITAGVASRADAQSARWTDALADFDAADRAAPPRTGEVVFIGSSTIAGWDVANAFPGSRVINRGVWGSTLTDIVRRLDRLVIPYAPRLLVVYAGENDINAGMTSEQVAVEFERLVAYVHTALPRTRILYVGIKPTPARWLQVHRMRAANDIIREFCAHDDRLAFLEVDGVMLGWDEHPRKELFVDDGLHLSKDGYTLWSMLVRPFLQ